jgi:hypothetical protein
MLSDDGFDLSLVDARRQHASVFEARPDGLLIII